MITVNIVKKENGSANKSTSKQIASHLELAELFDGIRGNCQLTFYGGNEVKTAVKTENGWLVDWKLTSSEATFNKIKEFYEKWEGHTSPIYAGAIFTTPQGEKLTGKTRQSLHLYKKQYQWEPPVAGSLRFEDLANQWEDLIEVPVE